MANSLWPERSTDMMIVLYVADWNISFHLRAIGINCLGSWNLVFCVTLLANIYGKID